MAVKVYLINVVINNKLTIILDM